MALGEYIVACTFDANSTDQYGYIGQPLISPGTSTRAAGTAANVPALDGPFNLNMIGGETGTNSVRGRFYLKEFRCYNCIPNETFVEQLAAGLITESPL